MSRSAYEFVEEAARWAAELARDESRGPGDYLNAMHRVARKVSVPYAAFWNLRYRKPKSIVVETYLAILEAYAEQSKKYEAERNGMEAKTKAGAALLRFADRLHRAAGRASGQEGGTVE